MSDAGNGETMFEQARTSFLRPFRKRGWTLRPGVVRDLTSIAEKVPTYGNDIRVFHTGDALYNSMLTDIKTAICRVSFEVYMFESDETGHRFARALSERARAGVKVRLIYDSAGSLNADNRIFDQLRKSGVEVLEFRPLRPWRKRFGVFGRNHRKILVVDGEIGYVGGMNVGDYWSHEVNGNEAWKDSHVRLNGPAAKDLEVLFVETWHRETGELLPIKAPCLIERRPDELSETTQHLGEVLILGGRGRYRERIRRSYEKQIQTAEHRIVIVAAYFIPDRGIRQALIGAAARGVEVILMLPEKSDVVLSVKASRHLFSEFLENGVRIFLWQPSILHDKSMIVDASYAVVGSSNFDSLSLNYNMEANAVLFDPGSVERMRRQMADDLKKCRELKLEEWRQRSGWCVLTDAIASVLRPWL